MSGKIINNLFAYSRQAEAENLVLSEDEQGLKISYYLPNGSHKQFSLAAKYGESLRKEILNLIEDQDFEMAKIKKRASSFKNKKFQVDFFLSVVSAGDNEKIIFDFKRKSNNKVWRLNELGIKAKDKETLLSLINKNKGLFIISGGENSGKSSSLEALINEIKAEDKSICLLGGNRENDGVVRMELGKEAFDLAKKADVDIICADEITDKEQLTQAFRLAAYGKLVLITIKSQDLKDLAKKIKACPWPEAEKKKLLKAVLFQKLEKIKKLRNNSKNARQEIGRFKLLSF